MKYFREEKIPIISWSDNPEEGALRQARNLANLPFAFHHIALMPDVHEGYGMPIGGVLAARDVVVPNAVGVDIGCGMVAVKTSLKEIEVPELKKVLGRIRESIPVGFTHHKTRQDESFMPDLEPGKAAQREYAPALKQVGTLGGGNHFIEIQKDNDGYIWLMVHSGSRNIGYKVAQFYNNLARKSREKFHSTIPTSWDLDFLPMDSAEGQDYLSEMNYCLEFARASRYLMMRKICEIMEKEFPEISFEKEINIHHNYASEEKHYGEEVVIHRKGATSARKGQLGIVPGSQGTRSYIVKGLGNPESFESCAHGAGRKMSRARARKELSLEKEKARLDKKGVLHAIRGVRDLDEAASAYKDIDEVMEAQKDLVEIVTTLEPLAVVKG